MKRVAGFIHRHAILSVCLIFVLIVGGGIVYAIHDDDVFELIENTACAGPGDVNTNCDSSNPQNEGFAGEDWENIYDAYLAKQADPDADTSGITSSIEWLFIPDPDNVDLTDEDCPTPDTILPLIPGLKTIFQGNETKDIHDIPPPGWGWVDQTPPDKNDLTNAFVALYRAEVDADQPFGDPGLDSVIYFGSDRDAANGDAQVGFWVLKNKIGLRCDGDFDGIHAPGDVLIITNFTSGGSIGTVNIYKWRNAGGPDTALPDNTLGGGNEMHPNLDLLAVQVDCDFLNSNNEGPGCGSTSTRDGNNPLGPEIAIWPYAPKQAGSIKYDPQEYPPRAFFEGGINLDHPDINLSGCFQGFLAESRSSQSLTAQRKDFVLGAFETCGISVTKVADRDLSKVGDTITYTITIENTGIVPLYFQSITDTLLDDTEVANAANAANCGTLQAMGEVGDSCTFEVTYSPQGGDPDPLPNTVTVVYREFNDLTGQSFNANASESVNLFQPSVTITKSGTTLSKVGDMVTYDYVINNTSSNDTPDLILDSINDTGDNNNGAGLGSLLTEATNVGCGTLASGTSCNFSVNYTVLEGDDDPLDNTVEVHYHPDGFSNDISDTDDHTVELFQASIEVDKNGPSLSKVGDQIDYTITVTNTSSADTPALTCTVDDELLGLDDAPVAIGGPNALGSYTPQTLPASEDVTNTAIVTCSVDGFSNTVSNSDSHTVDLFEPGILVDKDGPALSKVGDQIDYTITVTNTSSSNTPALTCTVDDALLGLDDAPVAIGGPNALGSYTPQTLPASEDVTNTATVTCSITGFANTVSNGDSHTVDLFEPGILVDKDGPALSKVGDQIDYTITVTNTSSSNTPALTCTVDDTLLGLDDVPVAIGGPNALGSYTPQTLPASEDVTNTATVTCSITGFANTVSNGDSHTVDLFEPGILVDKDGPALSKVGDQIDYTITVTNTSSSNTPALTCTVDDALLGLDDAPVAIGGPNALGSYTPQTLPASEDVTNTATVTCSITGFANTVSNGDSHTVDLFEPSITVDKDGPALSKVGDQIDYTITVTNTSSSNTPALTCTVDDALLGLDDAPVAIGGPNALGSYTPQTLPASEDVTNTATVTCSITGFANTVSNGDSHTVDLFEPGILVDKDGPNLSKVGDQIDYTITVTNTSSSNTPALTCTVDDALLGLNGAGIGFGVGQPLGSYTPQTLPASEDVTNTATVTCSIAGFANTVSNGDSHTVDLFEPSITVDKDGPNLSKVGDQIDYTITVTNTSSSNTPALTCTVDDVLLGLSGAGIGFGANQALGSYTPQTLPASEDVTNTATVTCSIAGFANTVSNGDSHTVDLFEPGILVDKDGPNLSKVGDQIDYTITVTNTSSSNTPALTCTVDDTLLGLDDAPVAIGGPNALGSYTPQTLPASEDVTNTATVTCSIAGFANTVGNNDSHTVDLFVPGIDITKSGDDYTKVGDTISYSATIQNTSSSNTPTLTIDSIMDSLAGDLTDGGNSNVVSSDCVGTLATSASCSIDFTYVTQESDDDGTLNNTVAVQTSIGGFPNDIDDDDSHEATIVHPSYTLDKSCQDEPAPLGSSIMFTVTLVNTGDVALEINLTDPDLVGSPLMFTLGVAAGACDDTLLDNNDPSDGCHRIEGMVLADTVGTQTLSTASGVGTINLPGLPNELNEMDDTSCEVEDVGATRTLGFWRTHGSDGEIFAPPVEYGYTCHVFEQHLGSSIDLGWRQLTTCSQVFAAMWAHPAKNSDGSRRKSKVCKALINPSWQLTAAILNTGLDNGASVPIDPENPGLNIIESAQIIFQGSNVNEIKRIAGLLDAYNNSGDDQAIVDFDGTVFPHADPNGTRDWAVDGGGDGVLDCN